MTEEGKNHFNHHCVCCGKSFTDTEVFRENSDVLRKNGVIIEKNCLYKFLQTVKINTIPKSIDDAILMLLRRAKNVSAYATKHTASMLTRIASIIKLISGMKIKLLGEFFREMINNVCAFSERARELVIDIYAEISSNQRFNPDELLNKAI